jgi:geranylgeranyl pyrophosphate synthase
MSQILTQIKSISGALNHQEISNKNLSLKVESALKETTDVVFKQLSILIEQYAPQEYWELIKYSIRNKKYLERAYYIRLSYENYKNDWKSIIPVLAAIELKYSELVIIDDVFDGNSERMNNPSVPLKYGKNKAVVIGFILKSISTQILVDFFSNNDSINKEVALTIISKDEYSHQKIYEGQFDDITTESLKVNELSKDFYLDMIRKTTGEDIGYCFTVGALLAGSNQNESSAFYEFGVGLGTIMQMRDDTIDYVDDSSMINKSPYSDLNCRKIRLPLLLAYEKADNQQQKELIKLLEKDNLSIDEKHYVSQLVSNNAVLFFIDNLILSIKDKAIQHLHGIKKTDSFVEIINEIFNKIILIN